MPRTALNAGWKACEAQLGRLFGCRRRPLSGGNQGGGRDDIMHPTIFADAKYGQQATPLWNRWREAKAKAKAENKTPLLAFKEKGSHGLLIVVHSEDLAAVLEAYAEANG